MGEDHIWAKTIYGIQHSGTGKSDPEDDRIQHSWQENQTQRPYMGKDHIWDSTQWDRKIRPRRRFNTVGKKTRPRDHNMGKDHIWAKTIYGQRPYMGKDHIWAKTIYGQRPYMGFNTVGQENQTQKTIGFNTVGRKTRPRDHIWAKTIYGQRPYMGKDHIWAKTIYVIQHSGKGKSDPKDDRIQHSWQENQTQRPYMGKDHIWDSTQWDRKIRPKRQ